MNLDYIGTLHEYNRLARQGFVPELTHTCGNVYAVTATVRAEEFHLKCFYCDTVTDPGLAELKGWEARIDDYKAKRK